MAKPNANTLNTIPRRHWPVLLPIGLVLLVLFVMLLGGLVVREGRLANTAMQGHTENPSVRRLLKPISEAPSRPKPETSLSTSITLQRSQPQPLRFEPLIPDAPDLPDRLRKDRASINGPFDRLLQRIEEYERAKGRLSPQQAQAEIDQAMKAWGEVYAAVLDRATHITLPALPGDSALGRIQTRLKDVQWWYSEARIGIYERQGNWAVAGSLSETYLAQRRESWELSQGLNPEGRHAYFRAQTGADEEYRRIIYCYWKQGGVNGYGKILDVALPHYYQKLADAWKQPSSDVSPKMQHGQ